MASRLCTLPSRLPAIKALADNPLASVSQYATASRPSLLTGLDPAAHRAQAHNQARYATVVFHKKRPGAIRSHKIVSVFSIREFGFVWYAESPPCLLQGPHPMRPLLKSLAMQGPFVREYVDRTRIVRRERDMLSEQVATLSKALHLPPAAATYGQAVVTDWSPAKARKQALSDAHLAVAASDRLTPLIEPVANHLNTVYAELV